MLKSFFSEYCIGRLTVVTVVFLNIFADPLEIVAKEFRLVHSQPDKFGARNAVGDSAAVAVSLAVDKDMKNNQHPENSGDK